MLRISPASFRLAFTLSGWEKTVVKEGVWGFADKRASFQEQGVAPNVPSPLKPIQVQEPKQAGKRSARKWVGFPPQIPLQDPKARRRNYLEIPATPYGSQ